MKRLLLLTFAVVVAGCSRNPRFLERSVKVGDHEYRYRVWLPPHYTKLHHWPVILYLHGSGERGDDNVSQLGNGLGTSLQKYPNRYHAVVVLPQCPEGQEWYGDQETQALAALDASVREFHGDVRRVYLTGVSMGGAGAWYMARHRRRFAALVPIAGSVVRGADDPFPTDLPPDIARIVGARNPYLALAEAIGTMPVWVFHGSDDEVVPVSESRNMAAALQHSGGSVRYTEYRGVGHECWDLAYGDANLPAWLLQQRSR